MRSAETPSDDGPGARPKDWLDAWDRRNPMRVEPRALDDLDQWRLTEGGAALAHRSGGFFSVVGLDVQIESAPLSHWQQPIVDQPEIGILGMLVTTINGVLRVLMQAKNEPGNPHGSQLSPTVQATRSNYMRVHGGSSVPYLSYFQGRADDHTLVDVLQSEHGSWFLAERNRNIVVEVDPHIEVLDGFSWFTLHDVHRALHRSCLVNMDARTVLGCLPLSYAAPAMGTKREGLAGRLARSLAPDARSANSMRAVLAAVTDARVQRAVKARRTSLSRVRDWRFNDGVMEHASGAFFRVVGTRVECTGREVASWPQPMIEGAPGSLA